VREGAAVVLADLDLAQTEVACKSLEEARVSAMKIDVADPSSIRDTVDAVAGRFGKLDILVNCAAVCPVAPMLEVTPESWDHAFAVNAKGVFFCMQAAARVMGPRGFGRIINISTPASRLATPLFVSYAASKAAVDSMSRSAAVAWARMGITVNTLVPGRMTGGMIDELERSLCRETGADFDQMSKSRTEALPMGRRVDPSEVARAAVWLASDAAAYVTAERFNFTGGMELS
jgi:NAD(P)-dependent dehydrogenase (short-subunit alcohol dehydrogenase family)